MSPAIFRLPNRIAFQVQQISDLDISTLACQLKLALDARRHFRRHQLQTALVDCFFILLWATGVRAQGPSAANNNGLAIGVYDYAPIPLVVLAGAEKEATNTFARFGVHLTWAQCLEHHSFIPCSQRLGPEFIQLNLLDRSMASRLTLNERRLGCALGSIIAIFYQPIEYAIGDRDPERAQILGRLVVNEMGHVLLGSEHADKGIMRATWSLRELQNDVNFTLRQEQEIILQTEHKNAPLRPGGHKQRSDTTRAHTSPGLEAWSTVRRGYQAGHFRFAGLNPASAFWIQGPMGQRLK